MRFLFVGAGAIGTYVGGALASHGHAVGYIEQPGPADVIARQGLRLHMGGTTTAVRHVQLYTSTADALAAGPYDAGVLALKSFDTAGVLDDLVASASAGGEVPPLLSLQNGVDNEILIAERLGADRVISGTVTSAIGKPGIGEVIEEKRRGIGIALGSPLSEMIVGALNDARLGAKLFHDARGMKWSKLFTNLTGNATSAILDMPVGALFADRRLYEVEIAVLRECLAVMRARDHRPVDLPGTPVRALALAVERLPRASVQPVLTRALGHGRGDKMPSFHIDLHAGRGRTEVNWLNGAVVRHGAEVGVEAPVNAVLSETLEALSHGELDIEEFRHNPDALLRRLA